MISRHSPRVTRSQFRWSLQKFRHRTALFSTSSRNLSYEDTIPNLRIGSHTRVVFQGFTGRQATFDAKQSLEYGTNIVGGVTPGRSGEHLGLPLLPNMRVVKEQLNPDATAVYVAAGQAAGAIEEAIEAEIPLIVAVAEHIPLHDQLRIQSMLRSQSKSRLVGANCPGMISPVGRCRIGFPPIPFFSAGKVGIVAKSGTLSYETVASTTRAGIGQSLVIGIGGDMLPGTDFVDALKIFEEDEATEGIILVGEIGGYAEEVAADWIRDYHKRTQNPKPIMGLIAGIEALRERTMGHAGALHSLYDGSAQSKIDALGSAGVITADHPAKLGEQMKELLAFRNNADGANRNIAKLKSPELHGLRQIESFRMPGYISEDRRGLPPTIHQSSAFQQLSAFGVPLLDSNPFVSGERIYMTIAVDRVTYQPFMSIATRWFTTAQATKEAETNPRREEWKNHVGRRNYIPLDKIQESVAWFDTQFGDSVAKIAVSLMQLFKEKEGFFLQIRLQRDLTQDSDDFAVSGAFFRFDRAAYSSAKRQEDIHAVKASEEDESVEVEAERNGIVYYKIDKLDEDDRPNNIGTLVNGAGLAMNTLDTIKARGGHCANFLDTGGKATRETVKAAFSIILKDPRVETIFVNIFGGLTLCDMIADGIILAYRDLQIKLPVVVRLRGTNEAVGQKMIAESGLPLLAFDDFEEAAKRVIELSGSTYKLAQTRLQKRVELRIQQQKRSRSVPKRPLAIGKRTKVKPDSKSDSRSPASTIQGENGGKPTEGQ